MRGSVWGWHQLCPGAVWGCSAAPRGCLEATCTSQRRDRAGQAARQGLLPPATTSRGLAVAQLFLNMSRGWVWKEILPFRESAKLQCTQLFKLGGPSVPLPTSSFRSFPLLLLSSTHPQLLWRIQTNTRNRAAREVTRWNRKVTEMEKNIPLSSPPLPSRRRPHSACRVTSLRMSLHESVNFFILTLLLTETL